MLEHNGKVYARVSDILKPFVDFGDIDPGVLQRKAELGTRIHDAIKQDIDGELPVVGFQEHGYFKSFEIWRSTLEPTFITTEKRMYCDKKMITGCIDALVKFEGSDEAVLVDWKTSATENSVTWPMQAHLYAYLLQSAGTGISQRFLFIKLDRYGNLPKVFQYKFDSKLLDRCLQAVDDFWSKNQSIPLKEEKCSD